MKGIKHSNTALVGALLCLFAVIFGAFGSHALGELLRENQRTDVYELANRYQFFHGLALLGIAALYQNIDENHSLLRWIPIFIVLGVVVFCGSLYLLALTNISFLGAITPIGGVALIIGWGILAMQLWRSRAS